MPVPSYRALILFLLLTPLTVWLAAQWGGALNEDHAWLTIAARRLLDGGTMAADFFDPNPPLSILMYVPMVLMERWLGIPAHFAPYIFAFIALILSTLAIRALLRPWPQIDDDGKALLLTGFFAANTLLTLCGVLYFGERDQIVILGLYPFILAQLALTWRIPVPRALNVAVFIVGAVAVLIKPHLALLPALLLIHRMAAHRNIFRVLRGADFVCLACAAFLYALTTYVFFPDYHTHILPAFLDYYLPAGNAAGMMACITYTGLVIAAIIVTFISGIEFPRMKLPLLSFAAAFICLLLFMVQGKGIYYHLFPAFTFFMTGFALLLNEVLRRYTPPRFKEARWRLPLSGALVIAFAALLIPQHNITLPRAAYKDTPVAQALKDCPAPCPFFLFTESMNITHQVALYTGAIHASRFPALWWLPDVLASGDSAAQDRFAAYVTDDLLRYKPQYIIIATNLKLDDGTPIDLPGFLSQDPRFASFMASYAQTETFTDNRNNYYRVKAPGDDFPLTFAVYKRPKLLFP